MNSNMSKREMNDLMSPYKEVFKNLQGLAKQVPITRFFQKHEASASTDATSILNVPEAITTKSPSSSLISVSSSFRRLILLFRFSTKV